MRDRDNELKIALASGLPSEFKEAITLGNKYTEYRHAKRYLYYLHEKGYIDDEILKLAIKNVEEYFAIEGLGDFQERLRDDELSNLGAVSNTKGYDLKNEIPIIKPPEERTPNVEEVMHNVDSIPDDE